MEVHDNNLDSEALLDGSNGEEGGQGSLMMVEGADGLPHPVADGPMEPPQALPFDAEHVKCLQGYGGKCRYYMQTITHFEAGNPVGTFGDSYVPTQRHHACLVQPGVFRELSADGPVYECNMHDPGERKELDALVRRREDYKAWSEERREEEERQRNFEKTRRANKEKRRARNGSR